VLLQGDRPAGILRCVFAGVFYSVITFHVAPVVQALQFPPKLIFTLIMSFRGAKGEKQQLRTCRRFALHAILANRMPANNAMHLSRLRIVPYWGLSSLRPGDGKR
jgi:hypothetical protein